MARLEGKPSLNQPFNAVVVSDRRLDGEVVLVAQQDVAIDAGDRIRSGARSLALARIDREITSLSFGAYESE